MKLINVGMRGTKSRDKERKTSKFKNKQSAIVCEREREFLCEREWERVLERKGEREEEVFISSRWWRRRRSILFQSVSKWNAFKTVRNDNNFFIKPKFVPIQRLRSVKIKSSAAAAVTVETWNPVWRRKEEVKKIRANFNYEIAVRRWFSE